MSTTQLNPLPRIAAAVACALAVAGGVVAQTADPVLPRAVIRVAKGVPVGMALLDLQAAALQAVPPFDVTFSITDVSLSDRDLYLLSYVPQKLPPETADQLKLLLENPPSSLVWGELLYANHDPEGHTGNIWFHSVGGIAEYQAQYAATTLGLPPAQQRTGGSGVIVAVLDTGIDASHPLLAGSILPGGFNFIADNSNTDDIGVGQSVGHGTFVAGLIHLVAPDADLLPIVVLNSDGIGDGWGLALALFYAIDQGVDVINLSLGSTYDSAAVEFALEEAKDLGIVVVAAGGNQNVGEGDFEEFPAVKHSKAFGVAALDDLDIKWSSSDPLEGSNFHPEFGISAPGASVLDAGGPDGFDPARTIYSSVPGGTYGIYEGGTSLAAAFVSGAAALVRAQHPNWPTTFMFGDDIVNEIEDVLQETSVEIYDPLNNPENQAFLGQLGAGRLDVAAATLVGAGDIDADGTIGITDMLALLAAWGECVDKCRPDLDADGFVGITDFLILLGNWG